MSTCGSLVNQNISGVMWKTVSESCNLACDYCYYSRCEGRPSKIDRINDDVLEKFIREYMDVKRGVVPFAWQGGEPLLAGLDFLKNVIRLQATYAPKNTTISNSIQTNGTLINKEWAAFFKKFNFLVGVSLDGPEYINDARRVTGSGKGSYKLIKRGIKYLKEANVEFNILTVVHENNVYKARELMDFYQQEGYSYIQFIPCMDFKSQNIDQPGNYLITPKEFGDFLCEVFDSWYNDGNPRMSIGFFDSMLTVYLHQQSHLCVHMETCPKTIVFEPNGDAYPCDFLIHEDYLLGNISEDSLEDIINTEKMNEFLEMKPALPEQCKSCEFLDLCYGGCPRNRMRENNQLDTDYFCESYKQVYRYAHKRMIQLANKIKKVKLLELIQKGHRPPARNDTCICGSRKKYKKCCGPLLHSAD